MGPAMTSKANAEVGFLNRRIANQLLFMEPIQILVPGSKTVHTLAHAGSEV
jgi:hypothetical protein